jgi:hypothetical protein
VDSGRISSGQWEDKQWTVGRMKKQEQWREGQWEDEAWTVWEDNKKKTRKLQGFIFRLSYVAPI